MTIPPAYPRPNCILILHGAAGSQPLPPDEQDVLEEVEAAAGALRRLGYDPVSLAVSLDLRPVVATLAALRPIGVFNLVEAIERKGRFAHLATALLDALGVPYTGCLTAALYETTVKILAKQRLSAAGFLTPAWVAPPATSGFDSFPAGRWILKPTCEDASIGLDADAVVTVQDAAELRQALAHREEMVGLELFAEHFVEGREISVALLESPGGVEVLPPSEILFLDFPPERPRIVDFPAKWEKESFEYLHTPRSFEFSPGDAPLLKTLSDLARQCWDLFGLRGYARVDFRVDALGRAWVLEVNANPAIGPDSGFIAAVVRHGRDEDWAIRGIVEAALPAPLSPNGRAPR